MGLRWLAAGLWASACFAQPFEAGGVLGFGIYRDVSVGAPGATAATGIGNSLVGGALIGEDLYQHVSGEVRYTYQSGDPFLSAGSVRGKVHGQSHSLTYDALFHFSAQEARFRPFVAIGVGAKYYRATGSEPFPQPLPEIASLDHANQWRFLADAGFGVKCRLVRHVLLRGEFRDYITPFPSRIIVPATHGTGHGLFQQFTPMLGMSYMF
ncbi:MAG: hypothetical protein ACLQU1_24895 [Bryobacteraceae bacterium]